MRKECESDDPENLEDEVLQWWSCKQHRMYPEHLYFKSSIRPQRGQPITPDLYGKIYPDLTATKLMTLVSRVSKEGTKNV